LKITVSHNNEDIGKRLDLFLSIELPQLSRSHIKKVIESNKVTVNDELCFKAGYKVKAGDIIDFPNIDHTPPSLLSLPRSTFDLEILHEDHDYLFINKPSGLIVHPANPTQNNTLVNKLLDFNQNLPATNILRPGIVHRLDKDTSGVIVVAKSPKGLWWLSQQFAQRTVKKTYLSIGLAHDLNQKFLLNTEFAFEGFMRRSSKDRKQFQMERPHPNSTPQGRFSKSLFTITDTVQIDTSRQLLFTKIFPQTGRTHQIRVHQKEQGFVIIKDDIYMSSKQKAWSEKYLESKGLKIRLYLHAFSIAFENYDGKKYSIQTEIPEDFQIFRKAVLLKTTL